MELNIEELQKLCKPENIIMTGEIIEQYPNDYPYPSCLTLGNKDTDKPLHAVVGTNGEQLWIVTAYYPSPEKCRLIRIFFK